LTIVLARPQMCKVAVFYKKLSRQLLGGKLMISVMPGICPTSLPTFNQLLVFKI